jgi:putative PIN family toxin of toxin-antitoxin system
MPFKILIDTNVWVSAFLNPSGYPAKIITAWLEDKMQIVISMPLLKEILDVLQRPKIQKKYKYSAEEIKTYLDLIFQRAEKIEPAGNINLCRDTRDNIVLETALSGQAKYLVTRDDDIKRDPDLIQAMSKSGIEVITVSRFLEVIT